ncbi:MAG TPA: cytochrome c-type biogenesis protein CcmH [Thermopetrobacter sp.]|nr:cytochrome c-type biogenesis protein CcmH [Thermopetrobacter sp.]
MPRGLPSLLFLSLVILLVFAPGRLPFGGSSPALAVEPEEMLADPALEKRARRISKELRCLVCQNENIDESNADLAKDLRILLRERLKAGDTDEQAVQFIVDRYGEYVLLKPRFGLHTLFLWIGPFLVLLLGVLALVHARRRWRAEAAAVRVEDDLSEEERRRLEEVLKGDAAGGSSG